MWPVSRDYVRSLWVHSTSFVHASTTLRIFDSCGGFLPWRDSNRIIPADVYRVWKMQESGSWRVYLGMEAKAMEGICVTLFFFLLAETLWHRLTGIQISRKPQGVANRTRYTINRLYRSLISSLSYNPINESVAAHMCPITSAIIAPISSVKQVLVTEKIPPLNSRLFLHHYKWFRALVWSKGKYYEILWGDVNAIMVATPSKKQNYRDMCESAIK